MGAAAAHLARFGGGDFEAAVEAAAAEGPVPASAAEQFVDPAAAEEHVRFGVADDRVGEGAADHVLDAADGVGAVAVGGPGGQVDVDPVAGAGCGPAGAGHRVGGGVFGARPAVDRIGPVVALEHVAVAGTAGEVVVADPADHLIARRPGRRRGCRRRAPSPGSRSPDLRRDGRCHVGRRRCRHPGRRGRGRSRCRRSLRRRPRPASIRSLPSPPSIVSPPPAAQIRSLPPPPTIVSAPWLPTITSAWAVPWITPWPTIVAGLPRQVAPAPAVAVGAHRAKTSPRRTAPRHKASLRPGPAIDMVEVGITPSWQQGVATARR